MARGAGGTHRWRRWLIGGAVVVVVLAVGGPFVFIHLIEGTPKAELTLPKVSPTTLATGGTTTPGGAAATAGTSATGGTTPSAVTASSVSGTWQVSSGSQAGYRVQEVLVGQSTTAVGRTSAVSGRFAIAGTTVTSADFTVQMATVVSNESQRNAQFDGRIMDVARYPTATFTLTHPISLGRLPAVGTTVDVSATGTLDMHGVTRSITIPLQAERVGSAIDVLGDADILFSDWDIANPSVGGFVTTADHGTLEVLLHLTRA